MGGDALITIGVTGKYCSGKSHIVSLLDLPTIDVDKLGYGAMEIAKEQVIATFGKAIVTPEGEIDRQGLGKIVFNDREELIKLERLLHPHMQQAVFKLIGEYRERREKGVVINAALLQRMKLDLLCDYVCYIYAPRLFRYKRAVARDGATIASFLKMEKSQKDINWKNLTQSIPHYILKNYGRESFISRQVEQFCVSIGL